MVKPSDDAKAEQTSLAELMDIELQEINSEEQNAITQIKLKYNIKRRKLTARHKKKLRKLIDR